MNLKIKLTCSLLLLSTCFLNAQSVKELFEDKLSPALLIKDVDQAYKELNQNHPNLDWFIEKKKLTKKIDSLKKTIKEPLTRLEFRYKLLTVIQSIGDGHITLAMNVSSVSPNDYDNYFVNRFFPIQQFDFKLLDTSLYVTASLHNAGIPVGAQVLSLNGVTAKEVIRKMHKGICADGYNDTFKLFTLNAGVFSNVYSSTFGYQDSIKFEIQSGEVKKTVMVATKSGTGKPLVASQNPSTFRFSNDWKYAVMKISSFDNSLSFQFGYQYESWFVDMMRAQNKTLVLDLRDNIGGDQNNATKLFALLIDRPQYFGLVPKSYTDNSKKAAAASLNPGVTNQVIPSKSAYTGKIYLLVNGGTFSAAAILAADLKATNNNVIVVGEESGGGSEGCTGGTFKHVDLANSNLTLRYGEIPLKTLGNYPDKGRGLIPGIKIKYTIADILAKRDLEMDWVLNDIKSK
ncbi:MAG: hypothetical protein EOO85_19125 [Pedobacter sp.]|nr:MAG: hypothetical protein EOO85_19125 [Pedobacter sp.]